MKVRRFQAGDGEAIDRLNVRLRAGGVADRVWPEGAEQQRTGKVRERAFVAEDNGEIRGGVWLREQTFRVRGEDVVYGWLKYPVAESLIDPRFNSVPGSLIVQCLREQPRLLALGLGGHETPLARMLKALRWTGVTVPMLVRFVKPARCLRRLAPLRRTPMRRVASDALAFSGLGWLAVSALNATTRLRVRSGASDYRADEVEGLGAWADEAWMRARDTYGFLAARDAATVESLTPRSPDIRCLRVRRGGSDVGWVHVLRHDFSKGVPDPNFGRLTVGMIADCLAEPTHAWGVVRVALEVLQSSGVDLVFSQQLHSAWTRALRSHGFLGAPSNFAFYASPQASQPIDWSGCHINRGDCDGPLWYAGR